MIFIASCSSTARSIYERKHRKALEDATENAEHAPEEADLSEPFSEKGYFIFLDKKEHNVHWTPRFKVDPAAKYDAIKLANITAKTPNKYGNERQEVLQGLAYLMSLFSGDIITFDFELVRDDKSKQITPKLIAPEPLCNMLHDMSEYNLRLNKLTMDTRIEKIDKRRFQQKSERHSGGQTIRSPYSIPIFANNPAFTDDIQDELYSALSKIREGVSVATATSTLRNQYQINVGETFYENVIPLHPLDYPNPNDTEEL